MRVSRNAMNTGWGRSGMVAFGTMGLLLATGCSDEGTPKAGSSRPEPKGPSPSSSAPATPEVPVELTPEEMVSGGRSVYNANCIACHSMNPAQDGALGPAVAGSSIELLEARILRSEYPEGYSPKRDTRVMVALPHLEPRIPELAAYLQSLE